ncbi:MAG: four helix bundle protein [Acidobacteriaceae bacterium]
MSMENRHFRDLQVWQRSMTLEQDVYRLTESFPGSELFGLTSQIRRAAVSVPSNIAEGRERMTQKSFVVFLSQARGSLYELETQIELARDLGFAGKDQADTIIAAAAEISRMLHGLVAKVRQGGSPVPPDAPGS